MDLLTVGTLAVTVGLRLGLPDSTEAQIWARGCYSLVILLLWLRLLQIVRCDCCHYCDRGYDHYYSCTAT